MIINAAKTEELSAATREAIVQLCIAAHQEEDFKNLFNYVASGGWHFLAHQDDRLVSHAMVTPRWLQPEGLPLLKTAYVDAVSTLPVVQGQGFGSAVMRRLAGDIAGAFDIGCLETDDRETFYARLDWETWRGPLAGRGEHRLVPTPEQRGIMVLRLSRTPVLDLDALLTIECQPGRIW